MSLSFDLLGWALVALNIAVGNFVVAACLGAMMIITSEW